MKRVFILASQWSITLLGLIHVGCALQPPAQKSFYIFQTQDRNFEEGRYGCFCSDDYSTRKYLNILSSGPFNSSFECESSQQLIDLRGEKRREIEEIFKNPKIKRYRKNIVKGEVVIDMPREAVLLSLGEPSDVNATETRSVYREQLVYPGRYIYIENGRVITIQSR